MVVEEFDLVGLPKCLPGVERNIPTLEEMFVRETTQKRGERNMESLVSRVKEEVDPYLADFRVSIPTLLARDLALRLFPYFWGSRYLAKWYYAPQDYCNGLAIARNQRLQFNRGVENLAGEKVVSYRVDSFRVDLSDMVENQVDFTTLRLFFRQNKLEELSLFLFPSSHRSLMRITREERLQDLNDFIRKYFAYSDKEDGFRGLLFTLNMRRRPSLLLDETWEERSPYWEGNNWLKDAEKKRQLTAQAKLAFHPENNSFVQCTGIGNRVIEAGEVIKTLKAILYLTKYP